MLTLLFLLLFFGLLAAGMPIFLVLGMCAGILYIATGQPLIGAAQMVINKLNSTTLMALPLFVMAAAFMRSGGVAKALVDVATAWLGGIRGSLGLVTVVACTLFAAICGSSVATALAMGTILVPAMIERGYPRSFALGVVGASGTIGIVVPPSLALILYGIVAEQSVPRLFLAGVLPGLLQAVGVRAWVLYDARRRNFPVEPSLPLADAAARHRARDPGAGRAAGGDGRHLWRRRHRHRSRGVVGGGGAVGVADLLSRLPLDRDAEGDHRRHPQAATIMLIVATALAFGHWMTESGIPNQLVTFVIGHGFATWQFLLIINGLLLVLGCFLEVTATLLLVLPILAPALKPLGVDPVHFSIIFTHNMEIGLVHPPVGLNLFVLSTISSAPIGEVIRGILPFLILLLIVLGIITYVPILTLWLPDAVFG